MPEAPAQGDVAQEYLQPQDDPYIGKVFGEKLHIKRRLGKGGMGAVYAAIHVTLNATFAVKVMRSEVAGLHARFRREARLTSQLHHPNIVRVMDFDQLEDGTPYLVMEYLQGEDLATCLHRKGKLTFAETVELARPIAAALSYVHALPEEVVHRDLKPHNIFMARHLQGSLYVEVPKIVDFGIAKIREFLQDSIYTPDQHLLGTPNYMSPEQARGENSAVDHQTDQWALAAILYECLTGRKAFPGQYAAAIYQVTMGEPQPLRELAPDVPAAAAAAIRRALSKDPKARFPDIDAFMDAFTDTVGVPARFSRKEVLLGGAAAILTIAAAVAALVLVRSDKEPDPLPHAMSDAVPARLDASLPAPAKSLPAPEARRGAVQPVNIPVTKPGKKPSGKKPPSAGQPQTTPSSPIESMRVRDLP